MARCLGAAIDMGGVGGAGVSIANGPSRLMCVAAGSGVPSISIRPWVDRIRHSGRPGLNDRFGNSSDDPWFHDQSPIVPPDAGLTLRRESFAQQTILVCGHQSEDEPCQRNPRAFKLFLPLSWSIRTADPQVFPRPAQSTKTGSTAGPICRLPVDPSSRKFSQKRLSRTSSEPRNRLRIVRVRYQLC